MTTKSLMNSLKSLSIVLVGMVLFSACETEIASKADDTPIAKVTYENVGDNISWDGAIPVVDVLDTPSDYIGKTVKLEGVARKICQKKGCWMTLDAAPHGSIKVTFKDYGFFVPMDIAGRSVIIEGQVDQSEVSDETREHYEKEEGMSPEEADEVIEAGRNLSIVANGVIIEYPAEEASL